MTSAVSLRTSTTSVDRQEQSLISHLPLETLVQVLKHLRLRDIVAFGITCKHFREISKADHLWSILFAKHFPSCKISAWTSAMTLTKDIPGCANLTAYKKRAMYSDPFGDPFGTLTAKIGAATAFFIKNILGIRL